ncbi:MAG: sigma-70 family RNA polymerase sigma factor [Bacteroidia bacterium]|nr:sigma-70 family RNA polymerase sigma factor [Bacteroidia bacterium]MCZ2277011.1 sigma-70 family RNA polymerase sigma factor [Bacteroidia bacterium]
MAVNHLSDDILITNYLAGDENGIKHLFLRYERRLFTSILILVRQRDLAEDLLQDTFIRIINTFRQGNYKHEGKFLGWALRISHNLVIDHFRKNNRMKMIHDTDEYQLTENLKLTDDGIEKDIIRKQTHHNLKLLIEMLPYEQREVLIMRHYGELSFKEIAEITKASINTCLGRMRYALINLRKLAVEHNVQLTND